MNSSLDKFVKNLSDEDFIYLIEEFGSEILELFKQKCDYLYKYMNSFERFNEETLHTRKYSYSSIKDGKIGDDGKISDGRIRVKAYLTCEKIWDKFKLKNTSDYHNNYLKKDVLLSVDVFGKFIATCLKFYGLDPCYYFSSPGLSMGCYVKNDWYKIRKNICY